MSLVNLQFDFLKDTIKLFNFIIDKGFVITYGEVLRTKEQQDIYLKTGKSKTSNSQHLKKLAIDLNFFKEGQLIYEKNVLQSIGDYWESLNANNRWGGNYKTFLDTPHFERIE